MNAVEIEDSVSKLVEEAFNAAKFPYAFLEAFGNKAATRQRLRNIGKNSSNKTNVTVDGVLAAYRLANITCRAVELLLPKFPARERIDLALADRFGGKVQPKQWFLVPLPVIEKVVERVKDWSISDYVRDVQTVSIRRRGV